MIANHTILRNVKKKFDTHHHLPVLLYELVQPAGIVLVVLQLLVPLVQGEAGLPVTHPGGAGKPSQKIRSWNITIICYYLGMRAD